MPNKLPWFPIDAGEWLRSQAAQMMRAEQEGAYLRLLFIAWGDGEQEPSLLDDPNALAQMSRLGARWTSLGPLIRAQFDVREGRLYSPWLSAIWRDQQEKYAKVLKAATAGGYAKAARAAPPGSAGGNAAAVPAARRRQRHSTAAAVPAARQQHAGGNAAAVPSADKKLELEVEAPRASNEALEVPSTAPAGAGASQPPHHAGAAEESATPPDGDSASGRAVEAPAEPPGNELPVDRERRNGGAPTSLRETLLAEASEQLPKREDRVRPRRGTIEEREKAVLWSREYPGLAESVAEKLHDDFPKLQGRALESSLTSAFVRAMRQWETEQGHPYEPVEAPAGG